MFQQPASGSWSCRSCPVFSLFFNTLLLEDGWVLVNGSKTIILNHSQKQGVPSEGHLSLSLQPHCCKFITRHCFYVQMQPPWVSVDGKTSKGRKGSSWKASVLYPGSLSRRRTSYAISSSLPQLPSPLPLLFYGIDWFHVAIIKYARLCLKTEAKSEKTINSACTIIIDCNCH